MILKSRKLPCPRRRRPLHFFRDLAFFGDSEDSGFGLHNDGRRRRRNRATPRPPILRTENRQNFSRQFFGDFNERVRVYRAMSPFYKQNKRLSRKKRSGGSKKLVSDLCYLFSAVGILKVKTGILRGTLARFSRCRLCRLIRRHRRRFCRRRR